MRSEEEKEKESYFGLQRFNDPEEAFKVMEGIWGDFNEHDSKNLHILTDEKFPKAILSQAIEKYMDFKEGKITEEQLNLIFGRGEEVTDDLFDFDFFLYSKKANCYFTSRMSFKDDFVSEWNERQWGYFEELWKLYSLDSVIEEAVKLVDKTISEIGGMDRGAIYDIVFNEEGLFY